MARLAPRHTPIITKGHTAQLGATLRAKRKMHNYLLQAAKAFLKQSAPKQEQWSAYLGNCAGNQS